MAAAAALREMEKVDSGADARRNVVRAIEQVAELLGNTPAVSRKSYVHPGVIDAYLEGDPGRPTGPRRGLAPDEAAVLALLRRRQRKEKRR